MCSSHIIISQSFYESAIQEKLREAVWTHGLSRGCSYAVAGDGKPGLAGHLSVSVSVVSGVLYVVSP